MSAPFFSVILPVYNGERYLREAIESVLSQTYRDWELIIVDDASTDGTPRIIAEFLARDSRIRSIRNPKNINCGPSSNEGIKIARGEWIARIDSDDRYHFGYLQTVFEHCREKTKECFFLSSWISMMDEEGRYILDMKLPDGAKVQRMMEIENFIYHPATSYPKWLWEKVGGYPPVGPVTDDRYLWMRFFEAGAKLEVIPRTLLDYRMHLGNQTFWLEDRGHVYDAKATLSLRKNLEWKISLFLKQRMLGEARQELQRLFEVDQKKSVKNRFYYFLTFLPSGFVSFFMWEIRPWFRRIFRLLIRRSVS